MGCRNGVIAAYIQRHDQNDIIVEQVKCWPTCGAFEKRKQGKNLRLRDLSSIFDSDTSKDRDQSILRWRDGRWLLFGRPRPLSTNLIRVNDQVKTIFMKVPS